MKQELDPTIAHNRYLKQAGWTAAIRAQWLERVKLQPSQRLLEVGSGTGAILAEISAEYDCATYGLDIDPSVSRYANAIDHHTRYTVADGLHLPFPSATFNITICHFLLLWLDSPGHALAEMKRVTQTGGWVLALAEPDYGGRIDYPDSLSELGALQEKALQQQGCNTRIGRKLRQMFISQRLANVCVGVLGGEWHDKTMEDTIKSEWHILRHDLENSHPAHEIERLHREDEKAWQEGSRLLFVPTFHAGGQVQEETP